MSLFTNISTGLFDVLFLPFGGSANWHVWISVVFWSLAFGVAALLAFKYCSNQAAIASAKNGISVHLLEIRLFSDDVLGVVTSTGKILWKNLLYVGNNMLPMAVMIIPFVMLFSNMVSHYALAPMEVGTTTLLKVALDDEQADVRGADVSLELPDGIALEAGPVRTTDGQVAWRLRADAAGDHRIGVRVGGEVVTKGLAVGGEPRKVPVLRSKEWVDLMLYPGEDTLPAESPVKWAKWSTPATTAGYPQRDLGWMPGGEAGLMIVVLIVSIAAAFGLKNVFDVTF